MVKEGIFPEPAKKKRPKPEASKENRHVNYHLGLREECEKRLGTGAMEVYEQLNRTWLS